MTQRMIGTNGHCILDDAYHYLEERGIIGRTHTITDPRLERNGTTTVHSGVSSKVWISSIAFVLATSPHDQH